MKLAIMTKSTFFVEEDKILSSLFDEGMDNLHLFKPGSSPMYAERLLTLLPEDYLRKITVHDHYYLKQEYDLAGIHIDDPLAPVPDGYKGKFSRTCTDLSMLKEMKKKSNYVFLKNIFDCIEFKDEKLESKGFLPEIYVQDFPIRNQKVTLCIKRRRWEVRNTNEIITRDWKVVQQGTRMTKEFADFLKAVYR